MSNLLLAFRPVIGRFLVALTACCFLPAPASAQIPELTVIVDMTTPFAPEGELSAQGQNDQRASIAADRTAILNALPSSTYTVKNVYQTIPAFSLRLAVSSVPLLQAHAKVKGIAVDTASSPQLSESRVVMGVPVAEGAGFNGAGTVVAVLDTGVDKNHPALSGKVISEACYSTNDGNQIRSLCPGAQTSSTSVNSGLNCDPGIRGCDHGTHVAGIVAANGSVRGIAPGASIIAIQVFSEVTDGGICQQSRTTAPCLLSYQSDQMNALDRVNVLAGQGRNIAAVNLSLGTAETYAQRCDSTASQGYLNALRNLRSRNIAPVFAAGNGDSSTGISSPACLSPSIAVGNTTKGDTPYHGASGTNSSSLLRFWAPGQGINSTCLGNTNCSKSGTSMASPHVAGAYAVLRQAFGALPLDDATQRLESSGRLITDSTNNVTKPRPNIGATLNLPGPPKNLFIELEEYCYNAYTLYWGAADGSVSHYEVWRGNSSQPQHFVGTTSGLQHPFRFPNSYAHVRACGSTGCGPYAVDGPTLPDSNYTYCP